MQILKCTVGSALTNAYPYVTYTWKIPSCSFPARSSCWSDFCRHELILPILGKTRVSGIVLCVLCCVTVAVCLSVLQLIDTWTVSSFCLSMNKAAKDITYKGFLWTCVFIPLVNITETVISGSRGRCVFNFWGNCQFSSVCTIYIPASSVCVFWLLHRFAVTWCSFSSWAFMDLLEQLREADLLQPEDLGLDLSRGRLSGSSASRRWRPGTRTATSTVSGGPRPLRCIQEEHGDHSQGSSTNRTSFLRALGQGLSSNLPGPYDLCSRWGCPACFPLCGAPET